MTPLGAAAQDTAGCPAPAVDSLWSVIPADARAGLVRDDEHTRAEVATMELDGTAPAEAVLALDSLISELESDLGEPRTAIFVARCVASRWRFVGRVDLEIDRGWDGTIDERPGLISMRAETLPGVGHDFARIEQRDVCGSHDPRYVARRFVLLHVVGDEVVVAFDAVVRMETESGPDRSAGPTTLRTVMYDRAAPVIRLRVSETRPDGRRRTICRTTLRFDGRTFVDEDRNCH